MNIIHPYISNKSIFKHFLSYLTLGLLSGIRMATLSASVPNLAGCHTQAKSLDELMECIREAIALCLEFEEEQQDSLDFVSAIITRTALTHGLTLVT